MLPRDFIRRCAAALPDKIAYYDAERSITWGEIDRRSDAFAGAMQNLGIGKSDAVGILSLEHIEVYEHLFACYKLGAPRVGINARYAQREMLHVIRDSDMRLLLIHAACVDLLRDRIDELIAEGRLLVGYGGDHGLPHDYETLLVDAPDAPDLPALDEEDLIAVSYTSGTTGVPKGVMLTQRGMRESMLHTVLGIGLQHKDVWFTPTASAWVTFVLSSMNMVNGMSVLIPSGGFEPRRGLEYIGRYGVTAIILVPVMIQRVLAEYASGDFDLSTLRLLVYGSSPARPSLIRQTMDTFGCEMMQIYGLTECTGGWVSFLQHADHLKGLAGDEGLLASCGRAGMHMEVSIRDAQGQPLPTGETGEVWLRSDTNMVGYLNLPDQSAGALKGDGWLSTNDLGRLDEHGYLYLTDRKNYLIITGAANVFPSSVETVLSEHPAVREVAVVGAPHPEWGEAVVAAVSLHDGRQATPEELTAFCREKLAGYEVPKHVEILDDLPKGITGKILKSTIQARYRKEGNKLPWAPPED
ncbi:MAG: AMP-binding protein [Pseudomonadota bacterium]|nr:AMP-binding protein [Pseudomonadota bacterium]